MARKSRKNISVQTENEVVKQEKTYTTAIYARLSKEDSRSGDDCSIETQIELVKQFISQKPYLKLYEVFADNGATGTNFNRIRFINMLEQIKKGNINCVIVKDLSRFGRDYIEVGNYLEKIFPFMNVRFISINDNYDSFDPNCDKESLSMALKSLIHDVYAKDISVKIKSALDTKRKNGEFIGNYPPFGYIRKEDNKSQFFIDEETASIVRDIFNWKMQGLSYPAIARQLNERDIPSPSNHSYLKGYLKNIKFSKKIYWEAHSVKRILANQVYIGNMVQGKVKSDIPTGRKQVIQDENEWLIIENTHEPIIEKTLFYEVQSLMLEIRNKALEHKGRYDDYEKRENILKGILICGSCGKKIKRYCATAKNKQMSYRYYCNYCNSHHKEINPVFMSESTLFGILKAIISSKINVFVDFQNLVVKMRESESTRIKIENLNKSIFLLKQSITKKENLLKSIYEDFKDCLLSKEEYLFAKERYISEHSVLLERLNELTSERSTYDDSFISDNAFVEVMNGFKDDFTINMELIQKLIDKIIINNDRSVEIQYKFKDEYDSIVKFAKDNEVNIYE